jgi:hypothetical protein
MREIEANFFAGHEGSASRRMPEIEQSGQQRSKPSKKAKKGE